MTEEQIIEEQYRLSEMYENIRKSSSDEELDKDIFCTKKSLEEGFFPERFERELIKRLAVLNIIKRDRSKQQSNNIEQTL